jgi:hypothetical protein
MDFIGKKIIYSTALIVQTLNRPDILKVESGTDLEFDTHAQPFTPHATGKVTSTQVLLIQSMLMIMIMIMSL